MTVNHLRGIVERVRELEHTPAKKGVLMHFPRKRWRLALMAVLAALAVSVTVAAPAFAAEPGESGTWNEEYVGNQQLEAQSTVSEARDGQGDLLQVWRGATNNAVWLSLNNENPYTLGTTATYVNPTVVPWGSNAFMVIHTGTDDNIYWTIVYDDGSWDGTWWSVPGQSTDNAVSATQMGAGSYNVLMMYQGLSNNNIYSTMYQSADGAGGWQPAEWVSSGTTFAAPGVAYNPVSGNVYAVVRGEDNQVWMNSIVNGQWGSWTGQGYDTYVQPTIAADGNGNMLVSVVDENSYVPYYRAYDQNGNASGGWSQDITGWQTVYSVFLSVVGAAIYAVFTGQNGYVYYKQAYYG
jgi:hypothetical protein